MDTPTSTSTSTSTNRLQMPSSSRLPHASWLDQTTRLTSVGRESTSDIVSTSLQSISQWMSQGRGTSYVHTVETAVNIKSLNSTSRSRHLHFVCHPSATSWRSSVDQRGVSTSLTRSIILASCHLTSLTRRPSQDLLTLMHIHSSHCVRMIQPGVRHIVTSSCTSLTCRTSPSGKRKLHQGHQGQLGRPQPHRALRR